jgi:quercetin dioxygenase-like cupin family protein
MTQRPKAPGPPVGRMPATVRSPRARAASILTFDLAKEADRLRTESPWSQHGSNGVTLVKYSDLRIVLIVMKPATRVEEHHAGARISVHTLNGHVRLHLGDETIDLHGGHLLALEKDVPHDLEAVEESAVLLTIAWQGE